MLAIFAFIIFGLVRQCMVNAQANRPPSNYGTGFGSGYGSGGPGFPPGGPGYGPGYGPSTQSLFWLLTFFQIIVTLFLPPLPHGAQDFGQELELVAS